MITPKHPEHLRHFAALRLEGIEPEQAWKDAIRLVLEDVDLPNYLVYPEMDAITFHPVVNTHGKYRRVIVPARTFALHKKSKDFNWKKVFEARNAIVSHFKNRRLVSEQNTKDSEDQAKRTLEIQNTFGGVPDEVKVNGDQIFVKVPVSNALDAKALLALWKMYQLEKK